MTDPAVGEQRAGHESSAARIRAEARVPLGIKRLFIGATP